MTIYLDSMNPFITFPTENYASLMDTLQVNSGKYWQCQDSISVDNVNDIDYSDWWASCFSPYNCSVWDLLPTFNITGSEASDTELMMTTYSFLLNTTHYDKTAAYYMSNAETAGDVNMTFVD